MSSTRHARTHNGRYFDSISTWFDWLNALIVLHAVVHPLVYGAFAPSSAFLDDDFSTLPDESGMPVEQVGECHEPWCTPQ